MLHLGSLFERKEVRDLLAILSLCLAVDPFGDAILRIAAMPRYGLTLRDAHSVMHHIRSLRRASLAGLADAVNARGLSAAGREGVLRLAADLEGMRVDAPPWEFFQSTFSITPTS